MPGIVPLPLVALSLASATAQVPVQVRVDSARREVVITAGPYRLAANPPAAHEGMEHEPEDVVFPRTVGIPLAAGHHLGLYIMWDNQTGTAVPDAYRRLTLPWISPRQVPKPVVALPFLVDVNFVFGGANSYAIPPGRSTRTYEFSVPLTGHLLAAGGHLHDHGAGLRLEDARSGKVLVRIRPKRAPDGRLLGMSRRLFGTRGEGPRLRTDRTYRLVVEYDNPTGAPLPHVMGSIAGLFVPDDVRQLPALDPADPAYQADVAWLARIKAGGEAGTTGHHHDHD